MRVILDANVLLSFLIAPTASERAVAGVVASALAGRFTLIVFDQVLAEVMDVVARKKYFRDRVNLIDLIGLIDDLFAVAEIRAGALSNLRHIARDPNDDYLLAAALLYRADVIVSGDRDLLALSDEVTEFQILSPRAFLDLLGD